MKNRILVILVTAVGLILIVAGIYIFQETKTSPAETNDQILLEDAKEWSGNLNPDIQKLTSFDGLTLKAMLISNETDIKNVAILAHGFGETKENMTQLAKFYYDQGFNILIPDSRGNGESEGNGIGYDWHDHLITDMVSWVHMMIDEYETENIILHGQSMGAAVVLGTSGENLPPEVKGIVADSGYTSVKEQLSHLGETNMVSKIESGFRLEESTAIEQVKNNTLPLFIIHGKADDSVPPEMGQRIYDAAGGDKKIWLIPDAGHMEAFEIVTAKFYERVGTFLDNALG